MNLNLDLNIIVLDIHSDEAANRLLLISDYCQISSFVCVDFHQINGSAQRLKEQFGTYIALIQIIYFDKQKEFGRDSFSFKYWNFCYITQLISECFIFSGTKMSGSPTQSQGDPVLSGTRFHFTFSETKFRIRIISFRE